MGPPVLEPPSPDLVVIQVDALSAALAKLQVTGITAAQLIDTIKREERKPPPASSNPERKKALLQLATKPPKDNFGSLPPYKSTFTKGPAGTSDKSAKARRLKLRDLARSEFPDGKIPDPEPMQTFEDAWVLWDTGAQVSQILSSQLYEDIKKNEEGTVDQSGFAVAKVRFAGVQLEIESNIAFRPHMPNNTTFIILGQQVFGPVRKTAWNVCVRETFRMYDKLQTFYAQLEQKKLPRFAKSRIAGQGGGFLFFRSFLVCPCLVWPTCSASAFGRTPYASFGFFPPSLHASVTSSVFTALLRMKEPTTFSVSFPCTRLQLTVVRPLTVAVAPMFEGRGDGRTDLSLP